MLFHRISEGDVIRTTPTPSPRTTRFLPILSQDQSQGGPSSPKDRSRPTTAIRDAGSRQGPCDTTAVFPGDATVMSTTPEASTSPLEKGKTRESAKLPPILKKPSAGSSTQFPKTARILTPTWKSSNRGQRHDDDAASSSSSTSTESDDGSDEGLEMHTTSLLTHDGGSSEDEHSTIVQGLRPSPRPASSSARMDVRLSGKANKKKPAFVASTATTKRRPSVGRRKSSQSSSSNTSKTASPRLTGQERANLSSPPLPPRLSSSGRRESSQLGSSRSSNSNLPNIPERYLELPASSRAKSRPSSSRPSRSASPVSSSQKTFQQSFLGDLAPKTNEEISEPSLQDWLVARDFRSKFVNSRNASQAASPATQISYMSAPGSTSTAVPHSVTKGKGKMTDADYADETVSLKNPGKSSSAIDSDDEDPPTLPRTKSQLTTLFERQKQQQTMNKGKGRVVEPKRGIPSSMVAGDDDEEATPSAPLPRTKGQLTLAAEDERRRETENRERRGGKGRKKHSR